MVPARNEAEGDAFEFFTGLLDALNERKARVEVEFSDLVWRVPFLPRGFRFSGTISVTAHVDATLGSARKRP